MAGTNFSAALSLSAWMRLLDSSCVPIHPSIAARALAPDTMSGTPKDLLRTRFQSANADSSRISLTLSLTGLKWSMPSERISPSKPQRWAHIRGRTDYGAARELRESCPVRQECLDTAMANPDLMGLWVRDVGGREAVAARSMARGDDQSNPVLGRGPTATLSVRFLGEELDYHVPTYGTCACGRLPSIGQPYRLAGEWALFRADYAVVNVLIATWSDLHSSPTLVGNAR